MSKPKYTLKVIEFKYVEIDKRYHIGKISIVKDINTIDIDLVDANEINLVFKNDSKRVTVYVKNPNIGEITDKTPIDPYVEYLRSNTVDMIKDIVDGREDIDIIIYKDFHGENNLTLEIHRDFYNRDKYTNRPFKAIDLDKRVLSNVTVEDL